ncbi:MAG: hypothetical protein ACNA8W_22015 [Bradymonadaceae bacterium]
MIKPKSAIHQWILNHDNSWAFIISYITLAVVLSIWISLFWLIAVVAVHGFFEWVCQREIDDEPLGVFARIAWELKLDVGLIAFALALGVYMEVVLGLVGLSAAGRAGVQSAGRFAVWQNALRGTLLSVDDAAQVVRMVAAKGNEEGADDMDVMSGPEVAVDDVTLKGPEWSKWGGWPQRWDKWVWLQLGFGVVCIGLILAGPSLTDHSFAEVVAIMAEELHPWPEK